MPTPSIASHFSATYQEARRKFLDAAQRRQARVESFVMPSKRGAEGEELATDVALLGADAPRKLLIVSSGTHGPEGFCGSGCQIAALDDTDLLDRLAKAEVGLLLVHAVNPHGFSHLHRVNEDNIDLNRNCIDFTRPLPVNAAYDEVEPLVLPATWPPTAQDKAALDAYKEERGMTAYRAAISTGQYHSPEGMFYGGTAPSWSNTTVRSILRRFASNAAHIGWIDVHTGLGPYGHGERLYPGLPSGLPTAQAWWGADVFPVFDGQSASPNVSGPVVMTVYDECPQAAATTMGLEFGTLPSDEVLDILRGDQWLRRHPEASEDQRRAIRQQVRDAFYCDNAEWKGMIIGQSRVALLQALQGLKTAG
jgi:hypothetical protein